MVFSTWNPLLIHSLTPPPSPPTKIIEMSASGSAYLNIVLGVLFTNPGLGPVPLTVAFCFPESLAP